jgi:hypothetical protein
VFFEKPEHGLSSPTALKTRLYGRRFCGLRNLTWGRPERRRLDK